MTDLIEWTATDDTTPAPAALPTVALATVLVVDDRRLNRKYLSTLVRYAGYRPVEAADGQEALSLARAERPALIISDILMPTLNGYELVQQLRADGALAAIPVIFYTAAYGAAEARRLAQACGVSLVLPKPSPPADVLDAIARTLGTPPGAPTPAPQSLPSAETDSLHHLGGILAQHLVDLRSAGTLLGELIGGRQPLAGDGARLREIAAAHTESVASVERIGARLCGVLELDLDLGAERDVRRLGSKLFHRACALLQADYVALGLEHPRLPGGRFALARGVDTAWFSGAPAEAELPGLLGEAVSQRAARRLSSAQRLLPHELPPDHPPVGAFLAVPLSNHGATYGWLYFAQRPGAFRFSDEDERVAVMLASSAAMFLENHSLYDAVQRQAAELQLEMSQRQRAEAAHRASEQRLEGIVGSLDDVVWSITADGAQVLFVGPSAQALYGYAAADFISDPALWLKLIHPDDRPRVEAAFAALATGGDFDLQYRIRHADGGERWLHDRGKPVRDGDGRIVRLDGIAKDISEARRQQERLDYLAYYDPLTGLANRRLFVDRLAQVLQGAQRDGSQAAVLLIDLERFKAVNEILGVSGGDAVLQCVAKRLLHFAGMPNHLARTGGNQFAVIVPRVEQAADLARLLDDAAWRSLWEPYACQGQELRLSARIGVAMFPGDATEAASLLANAESALIKARSAGERYLFYTAQMSAAMRSQLQLETRLRRAFENREFVLHYQPKLDLHSGSICGAEALIRWNSPDEGLVPPQRFVGVLEETGLIVEVGHWVLQQALDDHRAWAAAGLAAPVVAVNVSARQLRQADFEQRLQALLSTHAAGPAPLQLEITESLLMSDVDCTIARLERIRALGVGIAIDDFGTGYSSLSYLARLPIAAVKIDRSFVVRMTASANSMSVVSAIMSLAHAMNLKIVAEGVDSMEQLRLLRLLRCHEMQGFLFSPGVPAEAFARLLREGCRLEG